MKPEPGHSEGASVIISFVGDLPLDSRSGALRVTDDAEYIAACSRLRKPAGVAPPAEILVRTRAHCAWLKNFTEQAGVAASFIEKTARDVLSERWNNRIPDWLSDVDILDQKLLDIDPEPAGTLPFEQAFLSKFLGSSFKADVLDTENLAPVVTALAEPEADAVFVRLPVLKRCLGETFDRWAGRRGDEWIAPLCTRLLAAPKDVLKWLGLWACLHNYPEQALDYLLSPDQASIVRNIPPAAVLDVPLDPNTREDVLEQIKFILDDVIQQIATREDFHKVLGFMSGRLIEEFHFIESVLNSEKFNTEKSDVVEIRKKFASCPGISPGRLDTMEYFVKPKNPRSVENSETWGPAEWITWSVEEYIPYRSWQVRAGFHDPDVEKSVQKFSDWYIEEFTALQGSPEWSHPSCLESIGRKPEELSIVFLADCLPVEYLYGVDSLLRGNGFRRIETSYRFAGLPTTTENNKQMLLGGKWENLESGYAATLQTRSGNDWQGRPVQYAASVKALSELEIPAGPAVIVFNFLDGDELLHTDVESKGSTYVEELYRLYSRAADALMRIIETRQGQSDSIGLYLVTDHGACRILEEEMKLFESTVVSKIFPDEKFRCAGMHRNEESKIPANLWELGYRFIHPFMANETVYFLPKGHNTVRRPGKFRGYMHGGATPEEVIIPNAFYTLTGLEWKVPSMRFLNLGKLTPDGKARFYIRRVVLLEIEIQNSNSVPVAVTGGEVPAPEADVKSFEGLTLSAGRTGIVRVYCSFGKSALDDDFLEVRLLYEIGGEKRSGSNRIACEFKSAVSGGFDLKNLT